MKFETMRGSAARFLCLAGLAVLVTGLDVRADDQKPRKDGKPTDTSKAGKKTGKAKNDRAKGAAANRGQLRPGFMDLNELLKRFPADMNPGLLEQMNRNQMLQMRLHIQRQMARMRGGNRFRYRAVPLRPLPPLRLPFPMLPQAPRARRTESQPSPQETRLGVQTSPPSAAIADQLDLPRNQGMMLDEVGPNSPAGKAGLKPHDILLEVDGKPVQSDRAQFGKLLAGIAANKKIEVVVMRKGKKETLKGLVLLQEKGPEGASGGR